MKTTDPQEELLTQVDDQNNVLGPIKRSDAHKNGNYYRTIFVLVRDQDNRILFQKRSATKDLYPNCWDLSVGGHVDYGDSYEETAIRELQEELGLSATIDDLVFLKEVLVTLPDSHEFFHVFEYNLKSGQEIKLDQTEVSEVAWKTEQEVKDSMSQNPNEWYPRPTQVFTSIYP